MMTTKQISLNENDFKTLVSGGVVEQDGVKIILKDIGFDTMRYMLIKAEGEAWVNSQTI